MAELKRTLALFFEREGERLSKLLKLFGKKDRGAPRVSRRGGTRQPRPPAVELRRGRASSWRFVTRASAPLSVTASLLLHGILALFLILALPAHRDEGPEKNPGNPISIRLLARAKKAAPPSVEPPRPAESERANPREAKRPGSSDRPEEKPPVVESRPRESLGEKRDIVEKPKVEVIAADHPLRAPPLPLGLGGAPPPLPGRTGMGSPRGFSSRLEGKAQALSLYGGGGKTEGAVSRGLRWLAEHQDEDGGWSADSFQRHCRHVVACSGKGLSEFDAGISALAVLAFLGAGHIPDDGPPFLESAQAAVEGLDGSPFRRIVRKGLEYLLSHQDGSGAFGASGDSYLYNHAIAAFVVSEAYALTGTRRYRDSTEAAISFSISAQQTGGGWDYTSKSSGRNDLSITGWQVMALRSASNAGISVPDGVFDRVRSFLDIAVTPDGEGIYANVGQEAGRRGINMVSVGLLSRIYLGSLPAELRTRLAAERILRQPPDWEAAASWERTYQSYYYWYTATLALFHLGGDGWKAWNVFLQRAILPLQSQKGHEEGSWPPEPSWVGISGGRVYATAINVLTLETYYRYEPLFKTRKS